MVTKNMAENIKENEIEKEIEEQRAILQTYLASDMDIDEMDYNEVLKYALNDIDEDYQAIFLGHWKDYAFIRGKQEGSLSKQKEVLEIIDKLPEENLYTTKEDPKWKGDLEDDWQPIIKILDITKKQLKNDILPYPKGWSILTEKN